MFDFKIIGAAAIALSASAFSAQAATINLMDAAGTNNYGTLTYTGLDSDIQGFFNGTLEDTRASWNAAGDNGYESDVVETLAGLPLDSVNLGGTEIPEADGGLTWDVYGASYFTIKFGQSLFVLHNATNAEIKVTYTADDDCKSYFDNNQCSDTVSHSKIVPDGNNNNNTPPIPLPAAGWLMVAALGGLGAMRRRSNKSA